MLLHIVVYKTKGGYQAVGGGKDLTEDDARELKEVLEQTASTEEDARQYEIITYRLENRDRVFALKNIQH